MTGVNTFRIATAYLEFNASEPDGSGGDSPGDREDGNSTDDVASSDSESEWDEEEDDDDYN